MNKTKIIPAPDNPENKRVFAIFDKEGICDHHLLIMFGLKKCPVCGATKQMEISIPRLGMF